VTVHSLLGVTAPLRQPTLACVWPAEGRHKALRHPTITVSYRDGYGLSMRHAKTSYGRGRDQFMPPGLKALTPRPALKIAGQSISSCNFSCSYCLPTPFQLVPGRQSQNPPSSRAILFMIRLFQHICSVGPCIAEDVNRIQKSARVPVKEATDVSIHFILVLMFRRQARSKSDGRDWQSTQTPWQ
jgi:hypothetical protein